jgi:hypothetical protein
MGRGKPRQGPGIAPAPRPGDAEVKLRQAEQELREAIAEAHAMTKSLLAAVEATKKLVPLLVAEQINKELDRQLMDLAPQMSKEIDASAKVIKDTFDDLNKNLVNACRQLTGKNLPKLPVVVQDMITLIEAVAEAQANSRVELLEKTVEGKNE